MFIKMNIKKYAHVYSIYFNSFVSNPIFLGNTSETNTECSTKTVRSKFCSYVSTACIFFEIRGTFGFTESYSKFRFANRIIS